MPGGAVNFINTTNGGSSYTWNFGDASAVETTPNASHVYATSGSYNITLTATSQYGCTHDTMKVFSAFFEKPLASFSVNADTLCQGTQNLFYDESVDPYSPISNWQWEFGDNSQSSDADPVKTYSRPGNFDVKLTVRNAAGCSDDTTIKVIVYLQPVIDAGPSFVVPQGTVIKFNPQANDSLTTGFVWTDASGSVISTDLRPVLTAMFNEKYTLTATGLGDCTATDTMTVKILKPIKVPNAFSPNGDGINDTWVITNLSDYPGAVVEIFNRYGQSVFLSNGYSKPWDGTQNGKPLPVATYYYVIQLKNGFVPVTGSVTIVK
jgi:gliding motility-associated-like protein